MIEFLYSLPYDSFVIDGTERGLIRKAMDGIVPEDLLVDTRVRGQQSADWLQRLGPKWQSLRQELMSICNTQDEIMKYYTKAPIEKQINRNDSISSLNSMGQEVRELFIIKIVSKFMIKSRREEYEKELEKA